MIQTPIFADEPRRTLDDLVARSLAYRTGPELRELLAFAHRFPHVAPFNAMLLHMQNSGIRYAQAFGKNADLAEVYFNDQRAASE